MRKLSARSASTSSAAREALIEPLATLRLQPVTLPNLWNLFVPEYESRNYGQQVITFLWDSSYAGVIYNISAKRAGNRIGNYIDMQEMQRVKKKLEAKGEASIRFGQKKEGHGFSGERGDFCLVGGIVRPRELMVFYRSLEMIGGFAYDLVLFRWLEVNLKCNFRTITIFACKVFVFALHGNSNEKLYPKLKKIFQ